MRLGIVVVGILAHANAITSGETPPPATGEDCSAGQPPAVVYEEPCNVPAFEVEYHSYEPNHGDVCRAASGTGEFLCPERCVHTGGVPPYCGTNADTRTPCRAPKPTPPPPAPADILMACGPDWVLERHDHDGFAHGDVCRDTTGVTGAWECPSTCVNTVSYQKPYCSASGNDETVPCRVPYEPHARPYRCDPSGGERGVCVKAEGHPHFKGAGEYHRADCDGECGAAAAAAALAAGGGCKSDWDCSLAGICDQRTGKCACDSWATGSDCSYLNFAPVDKAKLGYLDPTHTSWGGNAVKSAADGKWHLFVAEIACSEVASSKTATRCGLSSWKTQSQVAHAVADHPAGPYVTSMSHPLRVFWFTQGH